MIEQEYVERLTRVEERSKSNTHQINELKPVVNEIHSVSTTLVKLVEEVRFTNETMRGMRTDIDGLNNMVDSLKTEPADDLKRMKNKAIDTVIGLIFGALASGIVLLIAQNIKM